MKKIYLSLMLLGALTFTSCDMDKVPYGSLDENTAVSKMQDLTKFRDQLYGTLRGVTAGNWVYTQTSSWITLSVLLRTVIFLVCSQPVAFCRQTVI